MGTQERTSPALEGLRAPATGRPHQQQTGETGRRLEIVVVYTSTKATAAALKKAGGLANRLSPHITLVVAQVVPYPLPLESPQVALDFSERRFREIASQSPVETTVRLYLCRNRLETLTAVLRPRSLVMVGGHISRGWWPTREKRLVRELRRAGYEVIVTEANALEEQRALGHANRAICPFRQV
jgi:hypothetical protein